MAKVKQAFSAIFGIIKSDDLASQRTKAFAILALQFIFALKLAIIGVGANAFSGILFVLAFDLAAFGVRVASKFKADIFVCYVPPFIFTVGLLIQQALSITKQNMSDYLYTNIYKNIIIAFVVGILAFFLWDLVVLYPEKLASGRMGMDMQKSRKIYRIAGILIWLGTFAVYLFTYISGKINGAHLTLFGIQVYEFLKITFILFNGYLLASKSMSKGSKFIWGFAFLVLNAVALVLMHEIGTLLVYTFTWLLTQIIFLNRDDVSDIFKWLKSNYKVLLIVGVVILALAAIVMVVEANADDEKFIETIGIKQIHSVVEDVREKYEERIVPWANGDGSDQSNYMRAAIERGGIFGLTDIAEISFVPEVKSDGVFSMVLHFFGVFGGLIFLLLVLLYSLHAVKSAALGSENLRGYTILAVFIYTVQTFISSAVAVQMLPIIGISLPMVSYGGAGYITFFTIIAVILKSEYRTCTSPAYNPDEKFRLFEIIGSRDDSQQYSTTKKKRGSSKLKAVRIIAVVLIVVSVLGIFGALAVDDLADTVFDNFKTVTPLEARTDSPVEEVADVKLFSEKYIYNVLVFGIDNKGLSDVMMLVSINSRTNTVKALSFQRDNYVEIAGKNGAKAKINDAYASGGVQRTVQTIENNFRVKIDDYVLLNFEGLMKAVNALGGIEIKLSEEEARYLEETKLIQNKGKLTTALEALRKADSACYNSAKDSVQAAVKAYNAYTANPDLLSDCAAAMKNAATAVNDAIDAYNAKSSSGKKLEKISLGKDTFDLKAGKNLLFGQNVLNFTRERHTNDDDSDYNRTNRQSIVIMAMLAKCKSLIGHLKIKELKSFLSTTAGILTTSIEKDAFMKRVPALAGTMLPMLLSDDGFTLEKYSIPEKSNYQYENIVVKGQDCIEPHLKENAAYIRDILKDKVKP